MSDTARLNSELAKLSSQGLVLPKHSGRAVLAYGDAVATTRELHAAAGRDLAGLSASLGRPITAANYDHPDVQKILSHNAAMTNAMGQSRALSRRSNTRRESKEERTDRLYPKLASLGGGVGSGVGGDVTNAIPRFYDPLEYWDLSGLPWNVADEGHRHKLHKWLRLYYATHYLVPQLIDIFTRFPLVGMALEHKDSSLKEVYEDIFLDNLRYDDFLVDLGREHFLVGEAFALGSFDEDLGVWEHEELIDPEVVVIDNFPLLNTQQLKIVPPDYLRRIAQTKSPAREWYMLKENYEELIPYLLKGEHIPISPVMLKQVANKLNSWDDHGTPMLLRGLRTLLHEEKLLASQDAIAERLYSPFLLAKLGIMDMGDGLPPWLPGLDELESVRDDIDVALASDFRLMVHHFGLELTSVFGREQMPRLGDDFDRIERRLMMVFGINPSLLSAGSNSQPYASSALQAEFMNQMMRTFQNVLKRHYRDRALVVAEAQGHQDYIKKGQTRVPVYETVVVFDDEGNKSFEEVPKYTVPELTFSAFDLRDEATERQFLTGLRQLGVPIPDNKLMIGVSWKEQDVVEEYNKELKEKTIAQQRAKMDTYIALTVQGLPVPLDLKAECESVLVHGAGAGGGMPQGGASPMEGGAGGGGGPSGGGPGGGGIVMPPPPADLMGGAPPGGGPPPMAPGGAGAPGGGMGTVPNISNERRPGLTYNTHRIARVAPPEDSPLGEFLAANPHEGIPFYDYVADQAGGYEHLASVTPEEVQRCYGQWPAHSGQYRATVAYEIGERLAIAQKREEAASISEDEVEGDDELTDRQELREGKVTWRFQGRRESANAAVIERPKKRRVEHTAQRKKKYSIVDPMALALEEDSTSDADQDPSE